MKFILPVNCWNIVPEFESRKYNPYLKFSKGKWEEIFLAIGTRPYDLQHCKAADSLFLFSLELKMTGVGVV